MNMVTKTNCNWLGISEEKYFAMEIFREFLESSTIHGLAHISSSKVSVHKVLHFCYLYMIFPDKDSKSSMGYSCLFWISMRRSADQQVFWGVARLTHIHHDHNPHYWRSRLSIGVCVSSKGIKHATQPRSFEGWQYLVLWRKAKDFERVCPPSIGGGFSQGVC